MEHMGSVHLDDIEYAVVLVLAIHTVLCLEEASSSGNQRRKLEMNMVMVIQVEASEKVDEEKQDPSKKRKFDQLFEELPEKIIAAFQKALLTCAVHESFAFSFQEHVLLGCSCHVHER